jgi:hypothetical protein
VGGRVGEHPLELARGRRLPRGLGGRGGAHRAQAAGERVAQRSSSPSDSRRGPASDGPGGRRARIQRRVGGDRDGGELALETPDLGAQRGARRVLSPLDRRGTGAPDLVDRCHPRTA